MREKRSSTEDNRVQPETNEPSRGYIQEREKATSHTILNLNLLVYKCHFRCLLILSTTTFIFNVHFFSAVVVEFSGTHKIFQCPCRWARIYLAKSELYAPHFRWFSFLSVVSRSFVRCSASAIDDIHRRAWCMHISAVDCTFEWNGLHKLTQYIRRRSSCCASQCKIFGKHSKLNHGILAHTKTDKPLKSLTWLRLLLLFSSSVLWSFT